MAETIYIVVTEYVTVLHEPAVWSCSANIYRLLRGK